MIAEAREERIEQRRALSAAILPGAVAPQSKPEGEMRWALYVTLSPVWFDPGEVTGQLTPFWVLYAFSFHRAKGSKILHSKVREVTVVSPARVRFTLHEPWPDFLTFYGSLVSGAGWIVPKKYVEQVGDDGFKKAPVGLGPYKFVSHTPGVEEVRLKKQ